jgi:hypothetical protein
MTEVIVDENTPDAGGDEPAEVGTGRPTARGSWSRRLGWGWALLATALSVALIVLSVVFSHGAWWGKADPLTKERAAALASAKSCIATMNTYDYRDLATARKKALACTTGDFTATYQKAFDSQIAELAPAQQATQTFQVNNAGVARVSPDGRQFDVLVFGQIATTNSSTGSTPRNSVLSAVVSMRKAGDHWLVAGYKTSP